MKNSLLSTHIYMNWSEGLLDSPKMHTDFLRALLIQKINLMFRGKREQLRPPTRVIKERSLRAPHPVATTSLAFAHRKASRSGN